MQILGHVFSDRVSFAARPGEADVTIGTNKIERRTRNSGALQFLIVGRIGRNDVSMKQPAEAWRVGGDRMLANQDQAEVQVAEFLKEIFDCPIASQLQSQPWEAITRLRRGLGKTIEGLR